MSKRYVEFKNARLGYGSRTILDGVNLQLDEGDFLGIVGPNGSGKTTLLRTLLGILPVLAGERRYGEGGRPRFGYVPQREALDTLYPFTVREVVTMGRYHLTGMLRPFNAEDRARIEWAMARAGVDGFQKRQYRDLSGGQKQRTLIARALALEPEVLILDEPTAGMDLLSSQLLMELVSNLHDEGHLTVVLVTHLLGEVANCAHSIAIVDRGRAVEGPTDKMLTSQTLTDMYGVPVEVGVVAGQRVIVPAPRTGESTHV
ncbi:MAG TPA: metal ABC transporter ATP-binding protein [Oscillatoriaceae cyanobacterium]